MIVEFVEDGPTEFHYRIKSRNGQIMLTSRSYKSYLKCVCGWRSVEKALGVDDYLVLYRWVDVGNR